MQEENCFPDLNLSQGQPDTRFQSGLLYPVLRGAGQKLFFKCKSHPRPAAGSLGLQNLCSQLNKSRWSLPWLK